MKKILSSLESPNYKKNATKQLIEKIGSRKNLRKLNDAASLQRNSHSSSQTKVSGGKTRSSTLKSRCRRSSEMSLSALASSVTSGHSPAPTGSRSQRRSLSSSGARKSLAASSSHSRVPSRRQSISVSGSSRGCRMTSSLLTMA